jgi:predicted phosphodiesterase
VLRRSTERHALLEKLADVDRLVLLGDVLELRQGPLRTALDAAEPVLRDLGSRVREVVLVPGNHDHGLAAPWFARRRLGDGPQIGLQAEVDWRDDEPLGAIAGWLGPGVLRVTYPGIWLRDDIYATHGHYLDRHTTVPMFERLGAGVMARVIGEPDGGPRRAEDYEAVLGPIYAWIDAVAQTGGPQLGSSSHGASAQAWRALEGPSRTRSLRRRGMVAAFPALIGGLNRAGLGPFRSDLSGGELRRAGLVAFGQVLDRLGIAAPSVIFGHTHRAGPLPVDERPQWLTSAGARMINTGSWVYEPAFLGGRAQSSPYRPGFAVVIGAEDPPALVNLLDRAPTRA